MTTFVFLPLRTMRGALLPLLILMAWEVSVRWHLANPRLLVSPSIVFAALLHESVYKQVVPLHSP